MKFKLLIVPCGIETGQTCYLEESSQYLLIVPCGIETNLFNIFAYEV